MSNSQSKEFRSRLCKTAQKAFQAPRTASFKTMTLEEGSVPDGPVVIHSIPLHLLIWSANQLTDKGATAVGRTTGCRVIA